MFGVKQNITTKIEVVKNNDLKNLSFEELNKIHDELKNNLMIVNVIGIVIFFIIVILM